MIRTVNQRDNGGPCAPVSREQTVSAALNSLAEFELGYGGYITDVSPTRVVVVTRVFNCVDTTTFEGTDDEMKRLVALAYYHLLLSGDKAVEDKVVGSVVNHLSSTSGGVGMRALYVTTLGGLLKGSTMTRLALMAAMDLDNEADIKLGLTMDLKTLIPLLELRLDDPSTTFREIVEQLDLAA